MFIMNSMSDDEYGYTCDPYESDKPITTFETTITWFSTNKFLPPENKEVLVRYKFDYGDNAWKECPSFEYARGLISKSNCEMDISLSNNIWIIRGWAHNFLEDHGIEKLLVTHWCEIPEFE